MDIRRILPGVRNLVGLSIKMTFSMALCFCSLCAWGAGKWEVKPETVTYDVMYKWGLINKKAGSVAMTTTFGNSGKDSFSALLTAASAPWADKFFMVRDTLKGTIDSHTMLPSYYEKISHEGGAYSRDLLRFSRTSSVTRADATRWRRSKKATEITMSTAVHEAQGVTLDMLSSYYFMRRLDYASMQPGQSVRMNVFSGKRKELLTIHYQGLDNVEIGKKNCTAYHITFTFTTEGGKESSDSMDAWISTAPSRIPLLLEGKLPVGKVRAVYSGVLP